MKVKIVPSSLLRAPENPGHRWDAKYLMVLADLLNPELSVAEAASMILNPEDKKHRINLSALWRAANSERAIEELAAEYGTVPSERIKGRLREVFDELLRRHRVGRRADVSSIEGELADLDRRFGAEQMVENFINKD